MILRKYAYGSYLCDVKHGSNPSRNHGNFGLDVLLKLVFLYFLKCFEAKCPTVFFQSSA